MSRECLIVIPSRLGSQRLARKPLAEIEGKSLIRRVWECGMASKRAIRVVVATDSEEIAVEITRAGGEVVMTHPDLPSGSDRVCAAADQLNFRGTVMNLQGDMPFVPPSVIDNAFEFFDTRGREFDMVTIASPILEHGEFLAPSGVKVVVTERGQALYFSRSPIPYSRDGDRYEISRVDFSETGPVVRPGEVVGLRHHGIYVFGSEARRAYSEARLRGEIRELSPLEKLEKLEQLYLLERGAKIGVHIVTNHEAAQLGEVNTYEELEQSRLFARDR